MRAGASPWGERRGDNSAEGGKGYWSNVKRIVQSSRIGPGSKGPIVAGRKNVTRSWMNSRVLSAVMPGPPLPEGIVTSPGLALGTQVGSEPTPECLKYPTVR